MLDAAVWEQAAHVLRRLGGAVESKIAEHLVDDPTEEALRRIELCFDTENRQRAKLVERLGLLEDGADAADDSALVNRAASERRKLERSGIRYWGRSNTSVSACAANSQRYALPWKYRSPGPTAGKVDARPPIGYRQSERRPRWAVTMATMARATVCFVEDTSKIEAYSAVPQLVLHWTGPDLFSADSGQTKST